MLVSHTTCVCSRNTAQKQWDETLVLVLSGIARILRSFFPFLRSLTNFWSGRSMVNAFAWLHNFSYLLVCASVILFNTSLVAFRWLFITMFPASHTAGWESLILFVKNSILNGSKEVALAAINCLQTTVVSHSPKVITIDRRNFLSYACFRWNILITKFILSK